MVMACLCCPKQLATSWSRRKPLSGPFSWNTTVSCLQSCFAAHILMLRKDFAVEIQRVWFPGEPSWIARATSYLAGTSLTGSRSRTHLNCRPPRPQPCSNSGMIDRRTECHLYSSLKGGRMVGVSWSIQFKLTDHEHVAGGHRGRWPLHSNHPVSRWK